MLCRIEFDAEASAEPATDRAGKDRVAVGRLIVAMGLGLVGRRLQGIDDRAGCRLIRIADSEVDEVFAGTNGVGLQPRDLAEQVGWNGIQPISWLYHRVSLKSPIHSDGRAFHASDGLTLTFRLPAADSTTGECIMDGRAAVLRWIDVIRDGFDAALSAVQRLPMESDPAVADRVAAIIADVRNRGDDALLDLGRQYDSATLSSLEIPRSEWRAAHEAVPEALRLALDRMAAAIRRFHEPQRRTDWSICHDGRRMGQLRRPLERVGIYVPGGQALYPSTVLMCGIPAAVAGVSEIILCTPCMSDGSVHGAILYAANLIGARAVYRVGGAQAIAAMALGTESVPRVDKIVGPGNVYVCEAKRRLWGAVDMDMVAGPSEVCIVADGAADEGFIAADMITQAEHDADCAALLITPDGALAERVKGSLEAQLATLPRAATARTALDRHGAIVITRSLDEAMVLANACAPEHLSLMVSEPYTTLGQVRNAGAVMMGRWTPQTAGDYIAGPSHTLPTGGSARFWSPIMVDSFMKTTNYMMFDAAALLEDADVMRTMARAEGLSGHASAVDVRVNTVRSDRCADTGGRKEHGR